jgi:beta-phosphoglucomutase
MLYGMIFDLDGVVADTHPIHKEAWRQLLAEAGRRVSSKQLEFVCQGRKREDILRHFFGALPAEAMQRYGNRKDELFLKSMQEVRAITGIIEFLGELEKAGMPKALATSAGVQRTRHVLGWLSLTHCFRAVVTGDDVVRGKPDPTIFLMAAQQLGLAPREVLVVEDSCAGVGAANAAGMKCLGVAKQAQATRLRREGADYIIPDFNGLTVGRVKALFEASQRSPLPRGVESAA